MSQTPIDAIEYIGGPFDGLLQFVDCQFDEVSQHVAGFVTHGVDITVPGTIPARPATSLALYELRYKLRDDVLIPYYAYLCSVSTTGPTGKSSHACARSFAVNRVWSAG